MDAIVKQPKPIIKATSEKIPERDRHSELPHELSKIIGDIESFKRTGLWSNSEKQPQEINSEAFSKDYQEKEIEEKKSADLWRWISFGLMVFIGISTFFLILIFEKELDWGIFFLRLITVFTFFIPAVFAAKQSKIHRYREREYQYTNLKLISLDRYLDKFPTKLKNKIKEDLIENLFINDLRNFKDLNP